MLVEDFFTLCRVTATKQFALDETALFAFLNLGITELNKKFDLLAREQIIEVNSARKEYQLLPDVMQVTAVYTDARFLSESAVVSTDYQTTIDVVQMPLNDGNYPYSVYTPSKGVLVVSNPKDNQNISVLYKASPRVYTPLDLGQELDIEVQYISPLVMYMGYLANLGLETVPGQAMATLGMFNQACLEIENYGLNPSSVVVNDKLNTRGFV